MGAAGGLGAVGGAGEWARGAGVLSQQGIIRGWGRGPPLASQDLEVGVVGMGGYPYAWLSTHGLLCTYLDEKNGVEQARCWD